VLAQALDVRPGGEPTGNTLQLQGWLGNREVRRLLASSRPFGEEAETAPETEAAIERARGGGATLDQAARVALEPGFGVDFSRVRVHADPAADALNRAVNARAFTTGHDIFFRDGEYRPDTEAGRELLAHELTHVVQQTGSAIRGKLVVGPPDDEYEREADAVAREVVRSDRTERRASGTPQLSRQMLEDDNDDRTVAQPKQINSSAAAPRIARKPAESEDKGLLGTAWDYWRGLLGGGQSSSLPAPAAPAAAAGPPAPKDPREVIGRHSQLETFGKGVVVTVTSTKRDPGKQLQILRNYCVANRTALDAFADATEWLKGELNWDAFAGCTLADDAVWLPFFMALYYGGGGPSVSSDKRTLPLVASPAQRTWKGKAANASPHLAGRAMDVHDGNLDVLSDTLKTRIPEFAKDGPFPIRSTQIEQVSGQHVVHINFEHPVF